VLVVAVLVVAVLVVAVLGADSAHAPATDGTSTRWASVCLFRRPDDGRSPQSVNVSSYRREFDG
jgi:hypothetical protein